MTQVSTLDTDLSGRKGRTYTAERFRALSGGILETATSTFLLLIAVRWHHAGANAKALIAAGSGTGMLFSPLMVHLAARAQWRANRAAAVLLALGSLGYVAAALIHDVAFLVSGALFGQVCTVLVIPLMTQIYQDNYPENERGRLFSRTVMIRILASILFSQAAGWLLTRDLSCYPLVLASFAVALAFSATCAWLIPSRALSGREGAHPLQALRYAVDDRVFGMALLSWTLMGFGNLMMVPLRVEYLASPKYGLALTAASVAFLNSIVPNLARLVMSPVWGALFDRANFFLLRIAINTSFMIGILTFFTGTSHWELIAGAIVFGISNAGGDVAWSLWVTKIAPPDRVADYMSVHTFLAGVRSLVAPFVAFHLSSRLGLAAMGWISAGLIGLASLLLFTQIRQLPARRKATPVTEEYSDER